MMKEEISCCGYRCNICKMYKNNIKDKDALQRISDGFLKYYGFRLSIENLYCDGCLPENCENPKRIDKECPVRPCVLEKGIPNCAYCDQYICDKLFQRIVIPDEVIKKAGGTIPDEDFNIFVRPYDNKSTLNKVRQELNKCE
ncbi:MAG: DUF3795 domain-containing protein [Sedimentisphaerales bacterium]|nr:DUF3795 domain-containing protein [Sedimentisphaerales bacterium]